MEIERNGNGFRRDAVCESLGEVFPVDRERWSGVTGAEEGFLRNFRYIRALDDKAEQLMHPPPPFSPSLLIIIYPSPERNGAARAPEPASKRA